MERTFLERKPSKNSIRGVIPDCNKTTGSSTSISYIKSLENNSEDIEHRRI